MAETTSQLKPIIRRFCAELEKMGIHIEHVMLYGSQATQTAKDGSDIVRMEFAEGKLKVSARGGDQEISTTIDTLNTQGEPGRTALDQKYLLGYLSGKQGIVIFSKYTDTGPVVFEYQKSPRVLIMPMAVQWGDETPPAEKAEPQAEATDETSDADPDEGSESSVEEETTEQETGEEEPVTE